MNYVFTIDLGGDILYEYWQPLEMERLSETL